MYALVTYLQTHLVHVTNKIHKLV